MIPQDWPNRAQSNVVDCAPHRWHVQDLAPELEQAPVALMLHGAGASTHSFAPLIPYLTPTHRIIAVDLPGQGFTKLGARRRCALAAMSADIAALCEHLGIAPDLITGHSAGAAIALHLSTQLPKPPRRIVALNGAFAEFEGAAGVIFPFMAKALSFNPFVAGGFARLAGSTLQVKRLIEGTGSTISPEGLELYRTLVANPAHVEATLAMMAQWDLAELRAVSGEVPSPVLLLTGGRDKAVPPRTSIRFAPTLPDARVVNNADAGHLIHEEAPGWVAEQIIHFWA